jgi:monoterpene epsilon-lactone hydrolase
MASWQFNLLTAYLRLLRILSGSPKQFDLAKDRADLESFKRFKSKVPAECQPVTAGGLPAEWLIPPGAVSGRTVLYLHGGGFAIGSINTHRSLAINIAHAAHARSLILEYRLAPEHPFPAASEDCLAAYRWLSSEGVRPEQLIVAGDSAGGTLTLLLLLRLRDLGLPLPALGVCLSPATDLTASGDSYRDNAHSDFMLDLRHIMFWFQLYLGDHDRRDPQVSPLYADLHGLPPLLIQVGNSELLFSDSTMFAERAREAGVDVTLEILERGQHVQQIVASVLPEAREAIAHIGQFIERRLGP